MLFDCVIKAKLLRMLKGLSPIRENHFILSTLVCLSLISVKKCSVSLSVSLKEQYY